MELLGNKNAARGLAKKAGVPTVPGSEGLVSTEEQAIQIAKEIGFPVSYQSVGGWSGGRGNASGRE